MTDAPDPATIAALIELLEADPSQGGMIEQALADPRLEVRERASLSAARKLSPQRLVELVSRGDSLAQRAAAMDALALAGEAAIPALLEGVCCGPRGAALFFLQVLGRIPSRLSLPLLRKMAAHSDPLLSQAALEALGHQRDLASLPLLFAAMRGEPWLTFTAIAALGEIGAPQAVAPLLQLRGDEMFGEAAQAALEKIRTRGMGVGDA